MPSQKKTFLCETDVFWSRHLVCRFCHSSQVSTIAPPCSSGTRLHAYNLHVISLLNHSAGGDTRLCRVWRFLVEILPARAPGRRPQVDICPPSPQTSNLRIFLFTFACSVYCARSGLGAVVPLGMENGGEGESLKLLDWAWEHGVSRDLPLIPAYCPKSGACGEGGIHALSVDSCILIPTD